VSYSIYGFTAHGVRETSLGETLRSSFTSPWAETFTVVDCGFSLEQDEELSFDTAAPRRNGATLATLLAADTERSVVAPGM